MMLNLFQKNKSKSQQLNWQEIPTAILFTAPSENLPLTEYAANLPSEAHQAQAQWVLLKELLDNGQTEYVDTGVQKCANLSQLIKRNSVCQNRIRLILESNQTEHSIRQNSDIITDTCSRIENLCILNVLVVFCV